MSTNWTEQNKQRFPEAYAKWQQVRKDIRAKEKVTKDYSPQTIASQDRHSRRIVSNTLLSEDARQARNARRYVTMRESQRRWRERNKEKLKAYHQAYQKANRVKWNEYQRERLQAMRQAHLIELAKDNPNLKITKLTTLKVILKKRSA